MVSESNKACVALRLGFSASRKLFPPVTSKRPGSPLLSPHAHRLQQPGNGEFYHTSSYQPQHPPDSHQSPSSPSAASPSGYYPDTRLGAGPDGGSYQESLGQQPSPYSSQGHYQHQQPQQHSQYWSQHYHPQQHPQQQHQQREIPQVHMMGRYEFGEGENRELNVGLGGSSGSC